MARKKPQDLHLSVPAPFLTCLVAEPRRGATLGEMPSPAPLSQVSCDCQGSTHPADWSQEQHYFVHMGQCVSARSRPLSGATWDSWMLEPD